MFSKGGVKGDVVLTVYCTQLTAYMRERVCIDHMQGVATHHSKSVHPLLMQYRIQSLKQRRIFYK